MAANEVTWFEIHRFNRSGFDCEECYPEFETREEAEAELKELRKFFPKEHFEIIQHKGKVIYERK